MTSIRSLFNDAYTRGCSIAIAAGLLLTALVPSSVEFLAPGSSTALLILGASLVAVALWFMMRPGISRPAAGTAGTRTEDRLGAGLLLYLSPVILLNVVYPSVSPALAAVRVGGVQLSILILASSVTVPWLAQAACLPTYRVIGDLMAERDMAAITRRFCRFWPMMFIQSLPLVALFVLPLWLASGWPLSAMATYAALCVLHLLFVQSLVLANVGNRRKLWAMGWCAYAGALFVVPTLWWLPPLLGTLTQVLAMRGGLSQLGLRKRIGAREFSGDLMRGLLMGAVLWADKFILFLMTDGEFEVVVVFAALLPAVIAYNFYFVNLAPRVDRAVAGLHDSISSGPLDALVVRSRQLSRIVDRSVLATGAICAVLTLAVSLLLNALQPGQVVLAVCAGAASWAFMMLTLLSYELDFIGEKVLPQVLGGIHLVICVMAFVLPVGPTVPLDGAVSYAVLGVADLLLVCAAWAFYKHHWSQPEYTLFWRHATSW